MYSNSSPASSSPVMRAMTLDTFISERLGAAAANIRAEVTELLAPLAEQNQQSRKELERLNRLLASVRPDLKLNGTDTMHHHQQPHTHPHPMYAMPRHTGLPEQGRSPVVVKEEPQHLEIKEEPPHHPHYCQHPHQQHMPMEAEGSAPYR